MRIKTLLGGCAVSILAVGSAAPARSAPARTPTGYQTSAKIIQEMKTAADAQLKAYGNFVDTTWLGGTFWNGVADLQRLTGSRRYAAVMLAAGKKAGYKEHLREKSSIFADNMCIGRLYETDFALGHSPAMLAALRGSARKLARFNRLVVHGRRSVCWYWCDALFMAGPVLAQLSVLTHDPAYRHTMNFNWAKTEQLLYSPQERLFFRDARFIHAKDPDGRKIFWSRGNGWVVAALAEILNVLPPNDPHRRQYVTLLRQMTSRLAELQPADGLWQPSLTDPAWYPVPESSGTALDCYAMAWGVRHKVLSRKRFMPVIEKAWAGLLKCRMSDGLIGRTQRTGASPEWVTARCSRPYSVGAFLMAGSQLARLAPFQLPNLPPMPKAPIRRTAQHFINHRIAQPTGPAFVRYVPERLDDIAWENDRIAYRIYGPQLGLVDPAGSGIDVWVKSVRYPVINIRYKAGNYHVDHGNGLDCYETGFSRGCGGLGIWSHGELWNSSYWQYYRLLQRGPDTAKFQVWYKPWRVGRGRLVWEKRTITLRNGDNLNRIQSVIQSNKPGPLTVGIGVANHGKGTLVINRKEGMLCYWEPVNGKNGATGIGVLVNPHMLAGVTHDKLNRAILLLRVQPGRTFTYYAGACWSKGLDFHSAASWERYLRSFKRY